MHFISKHFGRYRFYFTIQVLDATLTDEMERVSFIEDNEYEDGEEYEVRDEHGEHGEEYEDEYEKDEEKNEECEDENEEYDAEYGVEYGYEVEYDERANENEDNDNDNGKYLYASVSNLLTEPGILIPNDLKILG